LHIAVAHFILFLQNFPVSASGRVTLICQNLNALQEEVAAEKEKSKEEAEDLTQEMAELRYQLMEMIERERELRAQAEQASVLRVVELESQVSIVF